MVQGLGFMIQGLGFRVYGARFRVRDKKEMKQSETENKAKQQNKSKIRVSWKHYTRNILPHAKTQLQNFMLACMAEGKMHAEDDEEGGHRRGTRSA